MGAPDAETATDSDVVYSLLSTNACGLALCIGNGGEGAILDVLAGCVMQQVVSMTQTNIVGISKISITLMMFLS